MKSQNFYSRPLEESHILSESPPAIREGYSEEHGLSYDMRNAIDFGCDLGAPVRAALEGRVVHVQDGIAWKGREGPQDEWDGNLVMVEHQGDEFTVYGHLEPGPLSVPGIPVREGDVLGYAGHRPYLHFAVVRFSGHGHAIESLGVEWRGLKTGTEDI